MATLRALGVLARQSTLSGSRTGGCLRSFRHEHRCTLRFLEQSGRRALVSVSPKESSATISHAGLGGQMVHAQQQEQQQQQRQQRQHQRHHARGRTRGSTRSAWIVGGVSLGFLGGAWWLLHGGADVIEEARSKRRPDDDCVDFLDHKVVFSHHSSGKLLFSLFILQLCSIRPLVEMAPSLIALCESYAPLRVLLHAALRVTFFRHFCAGETEAEALAHCDELRQHGMRAILTYSIEEANDPSSWDRNTDLVVEIFERVVPLNDAIRFVPVKMTSLGPPSLLEHITEMIARDGKLVFASRLAELTPDEQANLDQMEKRLERICTAATKANVPVLLDAEQTHRQPAMDFVALRLCSRFGKKEPVVYNTYQMYLKDAPERLRQHAQYAEQEGFVLGVKLVRGAYIDSEFRRAEQLGIDNPIQPTKAHSDKAYNEAIDTLLSRVNSSVGLMLATHNDNSVEHCIHRMRELGLPNNHPHVNIGQLQGMAEHLSTGLAMNGYRANKLLAYGPMESVMPYLVRRLQENQSIFSGTQTERALMKLELRRRMRFWNN